MQIDLFFFLKKHLLFLTIQFFLNSSSRKISSSFDKPILSYSFLTNNLFSSRQTIFFFDEYFSSLSARAAPI